MTLNIGVIGVGMIGQDHIRRLSSVLAGARVVAVSDADTSRATTVAEQFGGLTAFATGEELIADSSVDAILVASWGPTHEQYVLAAVAAGKSVFCEKPLATTSQACLNIVSAEVAAGRRLVQVGFMRRYDPAYRSMKRVLDSGDLGNPLMAHCVHRNPFSAPTFTNEMSINDAAIHEFDVLRWLFDDDIVAAQVLKGRRNRDASVGFDDPLLALVQLGQGAWVNVEVNMNSHYGYDIGCEVVCDVGTVALPEHGGAQVKTAGLRSSPVPDDWRERFVTAYDIELQEWVDACAAGLVTGPTAWDGYMATAVSEAASRSLQSGQLEPVSVQDRPTFYTS
jgi:myo-inositol 2-dehydrogenase / D-chiro-inositol 1-dehydrogenase